MFSCHPDALCSTVGHQEEFLKAILKEPLKEFEHV